MKNDRAGRRQRQAASVPTTYDYAKVAAILERWQDVPGNLLPILHDVQEALGFVPADSVAQLARGLNLSRAEVHGVITFYHDFRQQPGGGRTLKICQAESCQAMGSRRLTADLEAELDCKLGETTGDGAVTLDAVYCLGMCACSPAVMIDEELIGRATPGDVLARLFDASTGEDS
ncbi:MAG: formate dehydrogenase subunit gamma [Pseudomonadota bacterium]